MILSNPVNIPVLAFIPRCFPNFKVKCSLQEPVVFLTGILWFSPLPKEISTFQEEDEVVLWGLWLHWLLRCQGAA